MREPTGVLVWGFGCKLGLVPTGPGFLIAKEIFLLLVVILCGEPVTISEIAKQSFVFSFHYIGMHLLMGTFDFAFFKSIAGDNFLLCQLGRKMFLFTTNVFY